MARRAFWLTHVRQIEDLIKTLERGKAAVLTRSPGGRPVYSISFGSRPKVRRTAPYVSAIQARKPEAFFGKVRGRTRSVIFIAGIHGMEVEGVMGLLNLARVLETGCDLSGGRRSDIAHAAKGLRIVLVPLANPDGRERQPREDLIGASAKEQRYYCQGRYPNGVLMHHPECKRLQPMPLSAKWLGGYFNDAGVNIQADCEFTNLLAPETKALLDLAVAEQPEAVVNIHSHSTPPILMPVPWSAPVSYEVRAAQVAEVAWRELTARGLRPQPMLRHRPSDGEISIDTLFHVLTGSLPLVYECPHGVASCPYTRKEILEIQMTYYEVILAMLADEGLRPPLPW
jgi:hypothetical protein